MLLRHQPDSRKTAGVQRQAPITGRARRRPPDTSHPTFTNPARANPQRPNPALSPAPQKAQSARGRNRRFGQPGGPPAFPPDRVRGLKANGAGAARDKTRGVGQPGGHSEGPNTRSHPELGRENPQRRWYCVLRRGRAGRRQARQPPSPYRVILWATAPATYPCRGVEQPAIPGSGPGRSG